MPYDDIRHDFGWAYMNLKLIDRYDRPSSGGPPGAVDGDGHHLCELFGELPRSEGLLRSTQDNVCSRFRLRSWCPGRRAANRPVKRRAGAVGVNRSAGRPARR